MTGFLDKLNVLVKSSLNNFLADTAGRPPSRLPKVHADRLGKDIDQEIAALRAKIDQALTEEDAMQQRLEDFQQQIASFDQQVDQALQRGDDAEARHLLQQMRRQEQLAAMQRAELEEHRQATSDFIQRVNTLDAIVSDARREQQTNQGDQTETLDSQPDRAPGAVLSNLLRDARERVEGTFSSVTQSPTTQPVPAEPQQSTDDPQVDEDLAKRRARLSKPDREA
jgi:phage shock protein A